MTPSAEQKRHPLMPFENKDTLQKLHVKNTPPEKEKCGTHKN